ncbi:MAG: retroviral-like aspartic protease family protein [Planctomycetaceae bacterium]|nr:retroviral-like aspartic protease family protein [Planctomycetaceae bacterium]
MGTAMMGKVTVSMKLQNEADLERVVLGQLTPAEVREVDVDNALVDTGATMLAVPGQIVRKLGLTPKRSKDVQTTNGRVTRTIFGGVRLTIQDRNFLCEVAELPDDCPALIGQIPLEGLDFVVDPVNRRLIGNPEHGGVAMYEEF